MSTFFQSTIYNCIPNTDYIDPYVNGVLISVERGGGLGCQGGRLEQCMLGRCKKQETQTLAWMTWRNRMSTKVRRRNESMKMRRVILSLPRRWLGTTHVGKV